MIKKLLISGSVVALLSSCTFVPQNSLNSPEYRNIRVTDLPPSDGCAYVGEIYGNQGNWFTGIFTSNVYLIMGARNSIRNQAAKYNANYVYAGRIKTIGPGFITGVNYSTIIAEAYQCKGEEQPEPNNIIQRRCGYFSFCLYDGESTLVSAQAQSSRNKKTKNKALLKEKKSLTNTNNDSQK